jgi:hypothetical protein
MARISRTPRAWLTLALVAALALAALPAAAQQLTGNIYGSVTDEQGGRLPGVTVTLTGIGAPRTQTTDARGEYRFVNLDPGSYTLNYDLQGFAKVTKSNVQVAVGQNTDTSAALKLSTVEATVTVTGEAALLDTRKVETGAIVDQTELKSLPSARDPWVVLQTVPGVQTDRINVGGNESGQQSNYTGKGTVTQQNVWSIDGVTITDMGALGSSNFYYDFDSFEEINASTGGADPASQTPGVQLNIVTKRGTNDIHGSARVLITQDEWQSSNLPDEALAQGFRGGNRIDEIQDYGVEVGGPLISNHLWAWGAYGRNEIKLRTINNALDHTTLEDFNGKLNAQIFEGTAATVTYTSSDKIKNGRDTGPLRPPEAGWNQSGTGGDPTALYKGELSQVFSPKFFATASYSYVKAGFQLAPAGGMDTNVYRDAGGVWRRSYFLYLTERPQHQVAGNGSWFFNTGDMGHELKFGFNYRETPVTSTTQWPGDGNWIDLRPNGDHRAWLVRRGIAGSDISYTSAYLGDTITMGNLTINAGLRWDLQEGNNKGAVVPENPIVPDILPALNASDASQNFEWNDISPRIGLTWAIGDQKKTIAKASYSRFADQLGVANIAFNNAAAISGIRYFWADSNSDLRVQRDEIDFGRGFTSFYGFDPANPTAVISPNQIDPDFTAGITDEIIVGVDHELVSDFVVGGAFTYRTYSDAADNTIPMICELDAEGSCIPGTNRPAREGDFGFVGNVEGDLFGGGTYSEPLYGLHANLGPTGLFQGNRQNYDTDYMAVELTFQKRLSNKWMARGNFSFSDWTQNVGVNGCAAIDPTNQRVTNGGYTSSCADGEIVAPRSTGSGQKGNVYLNSSWAFNIGGMYQLPWNFNIAANFFGREGYPYVRHAVEDAGDGLGDRLVIIENLDTVRHDDVLNLDVRLEKILYINPLQVALAVDVFNVLNDGTILQRQGDMTATNAGLILETQSPRVVRAGARVSW